MDMIKTGRFLAKLRKEQTLTQEQLGSELGVTNKTVSRWETGCYLPPVEMLQMMSEKYGVSINEILAGERLGAEDFRVKAEENIKFTLEHSAFTLKERIDFLKKKWKKEHAFEMTAEMLVIVAAIICGCLFHSEEVVLVSTFVGFGWSILLYNRMMAYVEDRAYGRKENSNVNKEEKKG